LGSGHSPLGNFGNVQISQLVFAVLCAKNISTLEISVEDLYFVKSLETFGHLNHSLPNFDLVEKCFVQFMLVDFLLDVSGVCQLHDNTQSLGFLIEEGFLIIDDIGMGDGGKDSDFIESVFLFFLFHLVDFDLG
jgi:hypothetical protein